MEAINFFCKHARQRSVWVLVALMAPLIVGGLIAGGFRANAAQATIAQGHVYLPDGSPATSINVSLHNGDGTISYTTTTDNSGAYTFLLDDTNLIGQFLAVAVTTPPEYMQPQNEDSHFTYESGDSVRTVDFTFIATTKTINITIQDTTGQDVAADVAAYSPDQPGLNAGGSYSGSGSISVTGGRWIVKADANLSEIDADRYPWVAVGSAQEVIFNEDDSEESADLTFEVARAAQKVAVTMLDKDGNTLTENNFRADLTFTGYNSDYGTIVTRRKVDENSTAHLYLIPGVWTVQAHHRQLEGQSYSLEDTTFVVEDSGQELTIKQMSADELEIGALIAVENNAHIRGKLYIISPENPDGELTDNITITSTNLDTGERFNNFTFQNGQFDINNISAGTYSVAIDHDGYIPVESFTVEVEVDEEVRGMSLVGAQMDTRVQGNVQLDGENVENLPATVMVEGDGITFTAPVAADGSFQLDMYTSGLPDETMQLKLVTQPGAEYFASVGTSVPIVSNSTFEKNIKVNDDEATINGNIINNGGENLTSDELGDGAKVIAINGETGSVEEALVDADGSYTLEVGPGEWEVYPQIIDPDATAIASNVSDQRVEVTAGETKNNIDAPVFEAKGEATGIVTNTDGDPVAEAPVLFTNLPALQAAGEVDPKDIISVTATTNADGEYTQSLPNGEFTVYFGSTPEVVDATEPEAAAITIKNNDVTADGEFREAQTTLSGVIDEDIKSAKVVLYSEEGGTKTLDVDDGEFSDDITPSEWQYVASGVKDGELWTDAGEITVAESGATSLEPKLATTGVDFPSSVSQTFDVTEPIVLSNDDGASVSLPAFAAGFSGEVTVEFAPDPTIQFSNGISQVGFAYNVEVRDADGFPVAQLNRAATVTLPLDAEQTQGLSNDELTPATYNDKMETYLYDGVVADVKDDKMVIQTTHLSRFAVTTTGQISMESVATPSKPHHLSANKIKAHSALLKWRKPSGTVTKYKLQVRKFKKSLRAKSFRNYAKVKAVKKLVKGLTAKTRYQFRARACNAFRCGAWANWQNFRIK